VPGMLHKAVLRVLQRVCFKITLDAGIPGITTGIILGITNQTLV